MFPIVKGDGMKARQHITRLEDVPPWVNLGAVLRYYPIMNASRHLTVAVWNNPVLISGIVMVEVRGAPGLVSVGALEQLPGGPILNLDARTCRFEGGCEIIIGCVGLCPEHQEQVESGG